MVDEQQIENWLNEGASDRAVGEMLSNLGTPLPNSYLQFIRQHNGGEGFVGKHYLSLWKIEDLAQFNKDYEVFDYAPGFIFFGSYGGGEGFAFDTTDQRLPISIIPFIGMSREDAIRVSDSFDGFFEALRKDEFGRPSAFITTS
ncbi:MAG: SMI1/KNR4 family protein [Sphingomonadaceae bacterium]|nr:SMI1/KNR4 family protein [Sphingomonadaceae bacterium]